jgi:hypothetical protein
MEKQPESYWSHVVVEYLGGSPRILNTTYGPYHLPSNRDRPFLVVLIDVDGEEWLTGLAADYQEAMALATDEAAKRGSLEVIDKVHGGEC